MEKKSMIRRFLPWITLLLLLCALVIFVGIPLYGSVEEEIENPPVVSFFSGSSETLSMENADLLFEMDPSTTHFVITEKETGRKWHSNPVDAKDDKIASSNNKAVLNSTLSVTYTTNSGVNELNNYTYSIENGSYDIQQLEDGSLKVIYSVGKIERSYLVPQAITKVHMDELTAELSKSAKKKITSNYSLYEPDKLDKKKNKDEVIAKYPSVVEQAIYILASDINENGKKKLEKSLQELGYSQEDYEEDMKLVAGETDINTGAVFNVPVVYKLEGRDLVVDIPYPEIRYKNDFPITNITVLPLFGAANMEASGFMLMPEGGGAIIRYNNGKVLQNTYYSNFYGWDYSEERRSVISETKSTYPVFGMTGSEGGSFLCMIEGGSSYAGVYANIAGRYNSYNYAYIRYNVLHAAQYNVSGATSQLVYMFEKEIPKDTVSQRYRFLDSDSYVGMAQAYGEYLQARYPKFVYSASEDVPVSVEILGAIDKIEVRAGLPVKVVTPTTTFSQAKEIVSILEQDGVNNLSVRMSGWSNGGVNQRVLTSVDVLRELGGINGMKELNTFSKEHQVPLYYDGINCFAYESGFLNGFIPFSHAARFATREQALIYPYSIVYYRQRTSSDDAYYLVKPEYAKANTTVLLNKLKEVNAEGVAFRDIGSILSGDLNPKDLVTREQVKNLNVASLKEAREDGLKVSIKDGNDYAVPYVDLITDMELTGNSYAILDEDVPFYQIALHGIKDYTGSTVNLNGNYQNEILRCAEYGAGLNFTFMHADGMILQDTDYTGYYSANFDSWKDEILEIIVRFQREMKGLNQKKIINHQQLKENVFETTYANGSKVYVNYGEEDQTIDNILIPAMDYVVKGGVDQ